MKFSGFCYDMNFHYRLPFKEIILIIHGSHSLYNVLTWVTLFSLYFKIFTKLALPMLKLDTNLDAMNHFLDISRSLLAST